MPGWRSSSPRASRRIPVYPVADGYSLPDDVAMLASNESPDPPLAAVVRAAQRALEGANRYPDPANTALKRALSNRYGVAPEPDRDRQRLLRHPARRRRRAAGAGRRARLRLAVVQRLPAPRRRLGRAGDHRAARRRVPRPRRDGAGDHRRDAPRDRLQPEQPDLDGAAVRRDRRLRAQRAAPRRGDRRRGLLRVQPARRPGLHARPALRAPQPRPAADLLEGLRPLRAARRLRAVRQRDVPARGRRRAPAVLLQRRPRRRRRSRRSSTRTPSPSASSARSSRASRSRRGWTGSGSAGRVAGELLLVRPARARPTRPRSSGASPSAACSCARERRWARRARCV